LRERRGDVPVLAEHFLERFARQHGRDKAVLSPNVIAALTAHDWPGNVRELENAVERAVLLARGPSLTEADFGLGDGRASDPTPALPRRVNGRTEPLRTALESPERAMIERALAISGGHRMRAAALLGITRGTLFNKMRKYGLLASGTSASPRAGQSRRKSAG